MGGDLLEASHEVSVTPAVSASAADLMGELAGLVSLAPELVLAELRPFVAGLRARRRTCSNRSCRLPFIQKQRHRRARAFHSDACRKAAHRGE